MGLQRLDHFAIVTHHLKKTIHFYQKIVGLVHGEILEGGFGEFLYFPDSNQAVIHLLSVEKALLVDNRKASGFQVHGIIEEEAYHTGSVDHIAFKASKDYYNTIIQRLDNNKIPYRLGKELEPKIMQVWFFDPNNIKVEITYSQED